MVADLKRAISMDDMLKRCNSEPNIIYTYPEMSKDEIEYLAATAQLLIGWSFLSRYTSQTLTVRITDAGRMFVESGKSFVKMIEDKKEMERLAKIKLEHEKVAHQVNKKTLAAAKREPWFKALSIISTIIALLLAYLQYIKN